MHGLVGWLALQIAWGRFRHVERPEAGDSDGDPDVIARRPVAGRPRRTGRDRFGVGMAVFGLLAKFERKLERRRMSATTERTVHTLGTVGYTAKGAAFAIVGVSGGNGCSRSGGK
jgi:hypothetical protein